MKHYKSVEISSCLECQAPRRNAKPPIENFLATVLDSSTLTGFCNASSASILLDFYAFVAKLIHCKPQPFRFGNTRKDAVAVTPYLSKYLF